MRPEFHGIHFGKPFVSDLISLPTLAWSGLELEVCLCLKDQNVWRYLKKELDPPFGRESSTGAGGGSLAPAVSDPIPPYTHPYLWANVPRKEVLVISDNPEGKCQAPLLLGTVPPTSKRMANLIFFKLGSSMIQEFHVFTVKPGCVNTSCASPPRSRPLGEITGHEFQDTPLFHWEGHSWGASSIRGGSQKDPLGSYITSGLAGRRLEGMASHCQ